MAEPATTVRVLLPTHKKLQELAAKLDTSISQVVAEAVDTLERKLFWDECRVAFERLRSDQQAWTEYLREQKAWEATLMDGIDPEEEWTDADLLGPADRPSRAPATDR